MSRNSIEKIYKNKFNYLLSIANRHIYDKRNAIDALHQAIEKVLKYLEKNPTKKPSMDIITYLIIRECKKFNYFSREVPSGNLIDSESFTTERDIN